MTAPIIYLQGSGGNLVARSLTLDPETVPYLPENLLSTALTEHYSVETRYRMYDNWDHEDWSKSERLCIKYHEPPGTTSTFEDTPLKLISTFHPKQFEDGERYGTWTHKCYWEHLIFIAYEYEDVEQIIQFAKSKRRDRSHEDQVKRIELDCIKKLMQDKPQHLSIHWHQLQKQDAFLEGIEYLADKICVDFYPDYVAKLWSSWDKHNKLLHI